MENKNWKVSITANAKRHGLTLEDIDTIFQSYLHEENTSFKKEHRERALKSFAQYPVAVWQLEKTEEMDNAFYNNMSYNISYDIITFKTSYEIALSEDFEVRDVIEWAEGVNKIRLSYASISYFTRIENAYLMLEELVKTNNTIVTQ